MKQDQFPELISFSAEHSSITFNVVGAPHDVLRVAGEALLAFAKGERKRSALNNCVLLFLLYVVCSSMCWDNCVKESVETNMISIFFFVFLFQNLIITRNFISEVLKKEKVLVVSYTRLTMVTYFVCMCMFVCFFLSMSRNFVWMVKKFIWFFFSQFFLHCVFVLEISIDLLSPRDKPYPLIRHNTVMK